MRTTSTTMDDRDLEMLDAIDATERYAASLSSLAATDRTALRQLALGWRTWLAAQGPWMHAAGVPSARPSTLARGAVAESGLEHDYPTDLLAATRAGWAAAVRGLGWQRAAFPDEPGSATALHELATRIETAPAPRFAPTPTEVAWEAEGFRLRRVVTDDDVQGEPILIVSSLINRWYVLDFLPGHSFVATIAGLGRPVYVLEGLAPTDGVDDRSLGDLCAGPLAHALEHVTSAHATPTAAVIGYCMGGTLAAMLACAYPERVGRLATVCGPVDFAEGGLFTLWFSPEYLDVESVAGAWNAVPDLLVHLPFWWLRPTIKLQKLTRLARSVDKPGFVDRFLALEVWNHDNVDMARGVFRSWGGDLYQHNALVAGDMTVDGEALSLGRIRCPVLVVGAEHDSITPAPAVDALAGHVGTSAPRVLRLPTSHTGVLTNPRHLSAQVEAFRSWLDEGSESEVRS